jgi:hypothetical protein
VADDDAPMRSTPSVAGFACVVLLAALATARPSSASVRESDSDACVASVLGELGWQLHFDATDRTSIEAGSPCDRADAAHARAAGDLRARLPPPGHPAHRDALLQLVAHRASECAFALRLGDATRRAVDRLVANDGFRFSGLQTGWIGFGRGGPARDGWTPLRSFARALQPAQRPSRAIEGFYHGTIRAECGVGRQIAQYATQYELHGAEGFDRAFANREIVVGTFRQLQDSDSVLLGRSAGELVGDGVARAAARRGRQGLAGLPGFIFHVLGPETLDDIDNQAENFVVYSVSAEAAAALRAAGSFEPFNAQAHSRGSYERLLHARDRALRARLPPRKRRIVEQMERILHTPFFQGLEVYVHPRGVQPVAYHFARLLDLNPRTPFRIELGRHNLATTLRTRWWQQRLDACADAAAAAALTRPTRIARDPRAVAPALTVVPPAAVIPPASGGTER